MPSLYTGPKERRVERAQRLARLIERAQEEETNWMYAPGRYGGVQASVIRTQAVKEWKAELAQYPKEYWQQKEGT